MDLLTFELVHKTFLFFERMGFIRPRVGAGDKERSGHDLLAEREWLELFSRTAAGDFAEAAKLVARSCRYWPKPGDMAAALQTVREERRRWWQGAIEAPYGKRSPEAQKALDDFFARYGRRG